MKTLTPFEVTYNSGVINRDWESTAFLKAVAKGVGLNESKSEKSEHLRSRGKITDGRGTARRHTFRNSRHCENSH